MTGDYALTSIICPGCTQPMMMRADIVIDEDGDRVLDTDMLDRGILLHLRLSCNGVTRAALRRTPEVVVEDEPVVVDDDCEP